MPEVVELIFTPALSAKKDPERESLRARGFVKTHDVLFLGLAAPAENLPDSSRFSLRLAEPRDLPVVAALQNACFDHTDAVPSRDELARAIDAGNVCVLSPKGTDEILGSTMFERNKSRLFIRHLAVSPAHRREGIGAALMSSMIATLRPGENCVLWVKEDNIPALRLYETLGFTPQPRRMEIWEKGISPIGSAKV